MEKRSLPLIETDLDPVKLRTWLYTTTNYRFIVGKGTPPRGFRCETCGKQLSAKRELRQHEAQHTGSRPFECSICSKWFCRKVERDQHELTHSHMCTVCGYMFTTQWNLNVHMSRFHDLLAIVKRRDVKSKQRLSAFDQDDNHETSPADQGHDDDSPIKNESQVNPTTTMTPLQLLAKLVDRIDGTECRHHENCVVRLLFR
jgi:hypothetical protein